MEPAAPSSIANNPRAAWLSGILPGLGQLTQKRHAEGLLAITLSVVLIVLSLALGRAAGRAAEVFFFMLLVLPWWCLQSYDAYLGPSEFHPAWRRTWHSVWTIGHDIRFLGALFLLSALNDTYIILMNPDYLLPFYCTKPGGIPGIMAKALSPILHVLVGVGFLRLHRWAFFTYLLYAGYGMSNALVNLTCFGPGRVRNTLLVTLVLFTIYILWRRRCFLGHPQAAIVL